MLYLFGTQQPKTQNAMGKIFLKLHLILDSKICFHFHFSFYLYPKIRCILHFKIDTCDFEKASIPLHIERSSALLKGNEDKAYHYIAKKQKWNYGTIYFSRQLAFQTLSSNLRGLFYFQIERNCRPDNYNYSKGLKLLVNILHLSNLINIQLEL